MLNRFLTNIETNIESIANRSNRLTAIADTILSKIAAKGTVSAYPCFYEYRCGNSHPHLLGALIVWYGHRQRRQCCCQSPVCGAYGCGPWADYGQVSC